MFKFFAIVRTQILTKWINIKKKEENGGEKEKWENLDEKN